MGVDYGAVAIVGVPVASISRMETRNTEVTRYNEKTGEPYQKIERQTVRVFMGAELDGDTTIAEAVEDLCEEHDLRSVSDYDGEMQLVGVELADVEACRFVTVQIEDVSAAIEKLRSIGIAGAQLYVTCEVG